MAKQLENPKDKTDLSPEKVAKLVYNEDHEIEWLDWSKGKTNPDGSSVKQNNAPGTKSIVNHRTAERLVEAKKAKIVRKSVKRKLHEDPKSKSKV